MRRRGVLDPARIDRSVRSVAILDTNSGENVDAILLVYPSDDASVVARTRAMKGLILALRGATRSLSGRDATCATLGADDEESSLVRVGLVDLARTGALLAVETTFAETRARRDSRRRRRAHPLLHGDSWVDRLRKSATRVATAPPTEQAFDASDADEPNATRCSSARRSRPSCSRGRRGTPRGSSPAWIPGYAPRCARRRRRRGLWLSVSAEPRRSPTSSPARCSSSRTTTKKKKKSRALAAPRAPSWRRTYLTTSRQGSPRTYRALRRGRRGVTLGGSGRRRGAMTTGGSSDAAWSWPGRRPSRRA